MASFESVSFIAAFAGGLLSVISPCVLPILPAFFAYNFKGKQERLAMTSYFFLGFTIIFIIMGLTASLIGQSLYDYKESLILVAGAMMIVFAFMLLLGKGFSFARLNFSAKHDGIGIFSLGMVFAVGWSPCLGPILAGILLIATTFSTLYSALLLFVYSLGIFVPLFLISFLVDKYNVTKLGWLRRDLTFKISNKEFSVHSTNLVSAFMLLFMGLVFIFYRGTNVINAIDPLGTRELFYRLQNRLISP